MSEPQASVSQASPLEAPPKRLQRLLDRTLLGPEAPQCLGMTRIALVAVFLLAYVSHIGAVDAYFSDASTLAAEAAREAFPHRFSLFFTVSGVWPVRLLFGLGLIAHVTWLLGFWTRTSAAVSWLLWVSMMGRQPLLYSLGDQLLIALCTLLALMPSGRGMSLDARRGHEREVPVWCRRVLHLQLATLYVVTGTMKTGKTWWPDGTALYYAAVNPYNRHFDSAQLLALLQPWFLRPMTIAVLVWEVSFGLFVLLHWWRSSGLGPSRVARRIPDLRVLYLGFGVMMHLGIAALLYVVWFTPLCLAAYVAFVEPADLQRWRSRTNAK